MNARFAPVLVVLLLAPHAHAGWIAGITLTDLGTGVSPTPSTTSVKSSGRTPRGRRSSGKAGRQPRWEPSAERKALPTASTTQAKSSAGPTLPMGDQCGAGRLQVDLRRQHG